MDYIFYSIYGKKKYILSYHLQVIARQDKDKNIILVFKKW